jgi:hypothetical protein
MGRAMPEISSTQLDNEYLMLMELFFNVVDSRAGQRITDETRWLYETTALAAKLFNHLATIRHLWSGTHLPAIRGQPRQFVDHSSISVLVRSSFEAYLTYYYIYGDTQSSVDVRKLRYDIWKLGGLLDRQEFSCVSQEKAHILDGEKEVIANILSHIESNPAFRSLRANQQTDARKGRWRLNRSWLDLAQMAGFDRQVFKDVYSYLCSYAHSGGLSALQIGQARSQEDRLRLALHSKYYGILLMSHFIASYTELFPDARAQLNANPRAADLARRRALTWKELEFRKAFDRRRKE